MLQLCPLSPSQLISEQMRELLDDFPMPVAIKDLQLCYQYANAAYACLLRVPQVEALLGKSDLALSTFSQTLREHFHQCDNRVLSNLSPYESILLLNGQAQMQGYWHQRQPLLDEHNQVFGVILNAKPLGHLDWLPDLENQVEPDLLIKMASYELVDEDKLLSQNELVVLFFLLRLGSFAAIAKHTGFSLGKIHAHKRGLYDKLGCQRKSELIKIALDKGYWFRIPRVLFTMPCASAQTDLPWATASVTLPP